MRMSGDFLDSNIILYSFDVEDAKKRTIAREVIAIASSTGGCISFQVVQEVLNNLTGPRKSTGQDPRGVLEEVLMPLWRVMPSESLYVRALGIEARYRYAFYDSLIIAAALEAGCDRLFSEDLQHGQRIERPDDRQPVCDGGLEAAAHPVDSAR